MPEVTDPWLKALRSKDKEAVEEFVRRHGQPLRRYLAAMVRSEAEAEDLAQEAFLRLLDSLPSFRGDSSLKTYLYRIAHNLALNHLASPPRTREIHSDPLPDRPSEAPSPQTRAAGSELHALLRGAVATLPPQQRAVVVLRNWQELSFKEIAQVLSLAEGTVKAHYFFALRNLRKRLEAAHET
jgi:RNA polymerase sigma-70 factor (ECF subfamily)